MNIINVEVCSIIIIITLFIDYFKKFKSAKNSYNAMLFYSTLIVLFVLSLINIFFYIYGASHTLSSVFLIVPSILLIVPTNCIFMYICVNNSSSLKEKKFYEIICALFSIFYVLIVLSFLINIRQIECNSVHCFISGNKVNLIILFPLAVLLIMSIRRILISKEKIDYRLMFSIVVPTICTVIDVYVENYSLSTFGFTCAALYMFLYKMDETINKDNLTKLYNRRIIDNNFSSNKEFEKKLKKDMHTAFYYIDVDSFKKINDTYGHDIGDQILIDVAEILRQSIRITDIPIRVGGDEFLIIATINKKSNINTIIDEIEKNLEIYNKKHEIKLSLSIGSSLFSKDQTLEEVIKKTDKKMYNNKYKKKKIKKEVKNEYI